MNNILKSVQQLIKNYSTSDPFELAQLLNIKLSIVKLPQNIRGFYYSIFDTQFIYINQQLDDMEQKLVCAHELGHAYLHPSINSIFLNRYTYFNEDKFELQADTFAANLLISDDVFENQYDDSMTFENLAMSLNIPLNYIYLKFQSLNNK